MTTHGLDGKFADLDVREWMDGVLSRFGVRGVDA